MTTQPAPADCCLCIDVGTSPHDRLELRDVGAFRPDLGERLLLKKSTSDFTTRLDMSSMGTGPASDLNEDEIERAIREINATIRKFDQKP